jgi:HSP20 family protein
MAQARQKTTGQGQQEQPAAQGRQMTVGQQGAQQGLARREESMPWMWTGGSPFSLVRRFSEDMDRFFGDVFADFGMGRGGSMAPRIGRGAGLTQAEWSPPIEIAERGDELIVCVDLPGITASELNVDVTDDMLTIAGERRDEREETGAAYRPSERRYGRFSRSIELPEGINPDDIRASFRNGVLEVGMPAPQRERRGRRIEIQEPTEGQQPTRERAA